MSALMPTDAASCRSMAAECGKRANAHRGIGNLKAALREIERARQLCILAIKFEQESSPTELNVRAKQL